MPLTCELANRRHITLVEDRRVLATVPEKAIIDAHQRINAHRINVIVIT